MKLKRNFGLVVLSLAGLPVCLSGQAIVEHAATSGAAATAVAGSAKNAGKAISGALKNLDGTLDAAGKKKHSAVAPAQSSTARPGTPDPSPVKQQSPDPPKPAKVYEDPLGIKAGMSYVELLRRFGEPAMKVTSGGEQTLYYSRRDGRGQAEVRVMDGEVLSVDAGGKRTETAVVE